VIKIPNTHRVELVSQKRVAAELGVTSQAISNWYDRELPGLPKAILVDHGPGSRPTRVYRNAQLAVWKKWHAKHVEARRDNIPRKNRPAELASA
jgi:hypothetical protein